MVNFLKSFAKGLLYLLVLPVLIVGIVLYGVVGIFIFLFLAVKGLILFFRGRSLFDDLPEDIEAKRRLQPQSATQPQQPQPQTNNIDTTISFDSPMVSQETEPQEVNPSNDPFYVPEYLRSPKDDVAPLEPEVETPHVEETPVPEVQEETPTFETEIRKQEETFEDNDVFEDEVIIEKKPSQNSTIFEINDTDDDDQDDDNSSGIDIEFH